MKQLIEDLTILIDKYNKENDCAIEEIKINTQTTSNPMCEKRTLEYNLTVVVNSL
jgi:hypothetical protein